VVNARSNALVGSVNTLPPAGTGTGTTLRQPDPAFLGGIGTGITQLFGARFPDYSAEVQLTIPLLNRIARADHARDQLAVRQQQIRTQQLEKQLRVELVNAMIAVEQSRAAYESAVEARTFQERSLEAERERYAVGASTNFLVIQYQRDLAIAQQTEVAARSDYATARAALQRATGTLLDSFGISVVDAFRENLPASQAPLVAPDQARALR
jgi:outer membrane protein TolC